MPAVQVMEWCSDGEGSGSDDAEADEPEPSEPSPAASMSLWAFAAASFSRPPFSNGNDARYHEVPPPLLVPGTAVPSPCVRPPARVPPATRLHAFVCFVQACCACLRGLQVKAQIRQRFGHDAVNSANKPRLKARLPGRGPAEAGRVRALASPCMARAHARPRFFSEGAEFFRGGSGVEPCIAHGSHAHARANAQALAAARGQADLTQLRRHNTC